MKKMASLMGVSAMVLLLGTGSGWAQQKSSGAGTGQTPPVASTEVDKAKAPAVKGTLDTKTPPAGAVSSAPVTSPAQPAGTGKVESGATTQPAGDKSIDKAKSAAAGSEVKSEKAADTKAAETKPAGEVKPGKEESAKHPAHHEPAKTEEAKPVKQ